MKYFSHLDSPRQMIDRMFNKAITQLEGFYEINIDEGEIPQLHLLPDRKTINELKGYETEDWLVGWTEGKAIYLLAPENFEQESSHQYSDADYYALLKHELSHYFYSERLAGKDYPVWLNEGLAIYLSGMNAYHQRPENFGEFYLDFKTFGEDSYRIAGFVVEHLVMEFGKVKLLGLLRGVVDISDDGDFADLFMKVYGIELQDLAGLTASN